MSNRLRDLVGVQARENQSDPTKPPAGVDYISWKEIVLDKRPPFKSLLEKAKKIYVPFYPYWSIFDRESDNFKSELTCFWNIANLLNATTGTVDFLEKAIERWKTVEISPCPGLQTKEERQNEIATITQYTNSPPYRTSWEQWINAGAPAEKALEFLAKNGLFRKQYEHQQNDLKHKAFKKNKDKAAKNKPTTKTHQEEDKAKQNSQKRARSSSQTNNPWKHPNVSKDWNTFKGSSNSHELHWNQANSYWQQGWASDPYSYSGFTSTPSFDRSYQQHWQQYPAPDNSFWTPASSSSSGATGSRDIQANRSSEGSRGPPSLRSRQELPDDHFQ
jgi:hypothetical protein